MTEVALNWLLGRVNPEDCVGGAGEAGGQGGDHTGGGGQVGGDRGDGTGADHLLQA